MKYYRFSVVIRKTGTGQGEVKVPGIKGFDATKIIDGVGYEELYNNLKDKIQEYVTRKGVPLEERENTTFFMSRLRIKQLEEDEKDVIVLAVLIDPKQGKFHGYFPGFLYMDDYEKTYKQHFEVDSDDVEGALEGLKQLRDNSEIFKEFIDKNKQVLRMNQFCMARIAVDA